MVRQQSLGLVLALLVTLTLAVDARAQAKPSIVGNYTCVGMNPQGGTYRGSVSIIRMGDTYMMNWVVGTEKYAGIGILEGDVLAVSYYGTASGVVVYKVEKGGKLSGKWTLPSAKGKVYTETLTKR
jgi:hypothetical protein